MSLNDRILDDINRVFINQDHFAERHNWNGTEFTCVTDEEAALKRKNNNVVDVSWDNHTTETLVYVAASEWPGPTEPNVHGTFDHKDVRILQIQSDAGMLAILLVANDPRGMSYP